MIQPAVPHLQDHLSKFQTELKQLRQQLETRKAKLAKLSTRRAELQTQLQQLEAEMASEIAALELVEAPAPAVPSPQPADAAAHTATGKAPAARTVHKASKPIAQTIKTTPMMAAGPAAPLSLKNVLLTLLKAARKPATSSELAERVLASGYKTTSKSLAKVVGTQLSKMDNVEHLKGQGYQLKR